MADEIEYKLLLTKAPVKEITCHPYIDIKQGYFNLKSTLIQLLSGPDSQHYYSLRIFNDNKDKFVELSVNQDKFTELLPLFQKESENVYWLGEENFTVARIRETIKSKEDNQYEITIKSKGISIGRNEVDVPISKEMTSCQDFLFSLADGDLIEKRRYHVPTGVLGLTWEVDIFTKANESLVIAEVEVPTLNTPMPKAPDGWVYIDVTEDKNYNNAELTRNSISKRAGWKFACSFT